MLGFSTPILLGFGQITTQLHILYAIIITLTVALEDEQIFKIEVNRPDYTGNASSEDESESESSTEEVVVVPKRQKKANIIISDIQGFYFDLTV